MTFFVTSPVDRNNLDHFPLDEIILFMQLGLQSRT